MTTIRRATLFLILGGLTLAVFSSPAAAATKRVAKKSAPKIEYRYRRLDGVRVRKGQENKWPVAVMIDNAVGARPQAGLDKAGFVYESLAEGGIPRFMAVFPNLKDLKLVGPVRSTRPYFVRYASEYGAAVAHAGGSPDGLKLVMKLRLLSLWGIKGAYAKYFYRLGSGVHSLFTTGDKLAAALKQARYDRLKPTYRPYRFTSDAPLKERPKGQHGATIDLGAGRAFAVRYEYDRKTNRYLRFTGGLAHRDRLTRKQIAAKNVIIIVVPKEKVLDKKGRLDLHTIGIDKGVLLQNGRAIPINWVKKSTRSRTIFKTVNNQEISLLRGNTWITVVPRGHTYAVF